MNGGDNHSYSYQTEISNSHHLIQETPGVLLKKHKIKMIQVVFFYRIPSINWNKLKIILPKKKRKAKWAV